VPLAFRDAAQRLLPAHHFHSCVLCQTGQRQGGRLGGAARPLHLSILRTSLRRRLPALTSRESSVRRERRGGRGMRCSHWRRDRTSPASALPRGGGALSRCCQSHRAVQVTIQDKTNLDSLHIARFYHHTCVVCSVWCFTSEQTSRPRCRLCSTPRLQPPLAPVTFTALW
jgi:hypothetical protein